MAYRDCLCAIIALVILGVVLGLLLACTSEPKDVVMDRGVTYITQCWGWNGQEPWQASSDNTSPHIWNAGDNCTDIKLQWSNGDNQTTDTVIRYRIGNE